MNLGKALKSSPRPVRWLVLLCISPWWLCWIIVFFFARVLLIVAFFCITQDSRETKDLWEITA